MKLNFNSVKERKMNKFLIGLLVLLLGFMGNAGAAEPGESNAGEFCIVFNKVYGDELSPLFHSAEKLLFCGLDDMYGHLTSKGVDMSRFDGQKNQVLNCTNAGECKTLADELRDSIILYIKKLEAKPQQ